MSELLNKDTTARFLDSERDKLVEGYFTAKYRDDDGKWVSHFERKNLIVNGARKIMAHAIGDCSGNYCINQFRLGGDNGLNAATLLTPERPKATDIQLVYYTNLFVRNRADLVETLPGFTVSYPNTPNETSVMFEVLIGKTEANILDPQPTVYVAAGLYVGGGSDLFASQTFPVITKTPNREFLFQWEIRF